MIKETKNMTQEEIQQLYRSNMQFVYLYTFNNGKYYVGQTHKESLRYGYASSYHKWSSQEMVQLMREGQYEKQILCFCDTTEEADICEDYYISLYNSAKQGYNKRGGGKSGYGCTVSEETRRKLSEANRGKNGRPGELNPMYGKHHSEETKRKMSDIKKGKYAKENHPLAKQVKLIDAKELTEKIYSCILSILDDYPDINYKSLYNTLASGNFYKKRYKIEYVQNEDSQNS